MVVLKLLATFLGLDEALQSHLFAPPCRANFISISKSGKQQPAFWESESQDGGAIADAPSSLYFTKHDAINMLV